jgi:tetratricopeptide (TPR) repeat protein
MIWLVTLALMSHAGVSAAADPSSGDSTSAAPSSPRDRDATPAPARAPPGVQLRDEAEFARAVLLYNSGRYADCVANFEPLVAPDSPDRFGSSELVERGRVYLAACLIGTGKLQQADEVLRAAVRANPQMSPPDSLVFPQAVVDRFLRVRQELMDEIRRSERQKIRQAEEQAQAQARRRQAEQRRTQELEHLASQQFIVEKNRRWIAMLPYGAGQFQNREYGLGWLFFGTEVALTLSVVGSLGVHKYMVDRSNDPSLLQEDVENGKKRAYQVLVGSSWGLLGMAAIGIMEAQISFVPEFREVRTRPLPERLRRSARAAPPRFVPVVVPSADGLVLGLRGSL